jgi:glycosyltransferase involved in cell wall biosynthesis
MRSHEMRQNGIPMSADPGGPLITTIIPTYCRPQLLARAIRSVLSQTYPRFRLQINADTSGEETMAVLKEYARKDPRVHYHRHMARLGLEKNFEYGMAQVETPFFSLLGDDDVLLPHFFERALAGFEQYPQAMCSACNTIWVDGRGKPIFEPLEGWREGLFQPPQGMLDMVRSCHPHINSLLVRREMIREIGIDVEIGSAFDLDFELRLAALHPIVVTLEPGALWVLHGENASFTYPADGKFGGWPKMIRRLANDARIPAQARKEAAQTLTRKAKRGVFYDFLMPAIQLKDRTKVKEVASLLRDRFGMRWHALAVRMLGMLSRYVPRVDYLSKLYRIRMDSWQALHKRLLESKWGEYSDFLEV